MAAEQQFLCRSPGGTNIAGRFVKLRLDMIDFKFICMVIRSNFRACQRLFLICKSVVTRGTLATVFLSFCNYGAACCLLLVLISEITSR